MDQSERIVAGYDGSEGARTAIEAAGRLFPGSKADVVTVWRSVAAVGSAANIGLPTEVIGKASVQLDREAEARALKLAEEGAAVARENGLDATARAVKCTSGNTWWTLVQLAEESRPAAVVVGSRGRSSIKAVLMGSVSTGVTQHSSVPVVVVPSPETEDDPAPPA